LDRARKPTWRRAGQRRHVKVTMASSHMVYGIFEISITM
jgi:hypothetical protein